MAIDLVFQNNLTTRYFEFSIKTITNSNKNFIRKGKQSLTRKPCKLCRPCCSYLICLDKKRDHDPTACSPSVEHVKRCRLLD